MFDYTKHEFDHAENEINHAKNEMYRAEHEFDHVVHVTDHAEDGLIMRNMLLRSFGPYISLHHANFAAFQP